MHHVTHLGRLVVGNAPCNAPCIMHLGRLVVGGAPVLGRVGRRYGEHRGRRLLGLSRLEVQVLGDELLGDMEILTVAAWST